MSKPQRAPDRGRRLLEHLKKLIDTCAGTIQGGIQPSAISPRSGRVSSCRIAGQVIWICSWTGAIISFSAFRVRRAVAARSSRLTLDAAAARERLRITATYSRVRCSCRAKPLSVPALGDLRPPLPYYEQHPPSDSGSIDAARHRVLAGLRAGIWNIAEGRSLYRLGAGVERTRAGSPQSDRSASAVPPSRQPSAPPCARSRAGRRAAAHSHAPLSEVCPSFTRVNLPFEKREPEGIACVSRRSSRLARTDRLDQGSSATRARGPKTLCEPCAEATIEDLRLTVHCCPGDPVRDARRAPPNDSSSGPTAGRAVSARCSRAPRRRAHNMISFARPVTVRARRRAALTRAPRRPRGSCGRPDRPSIRALPLRGRGACSTELSRDRLPIDGLWLSAPPGSRIAT